MIEINNMNELLKQILELNTKFVSKKHDENFSKIDPVIIANQNQERKELLESFMLCYKEGVLPETSNALTEASSALNKLLELNPRINVDLSFIDTLSMFTPNRYFSDKTNMDLLKEFINIFQEDIDIEIENFYSSLFERNEEWLKEYISELFNQPIDESISFDKFLLENTAFIRLKDLDKYKQLVHEYITNNEKVKYSLVSNKQGEYFKLVDNLSGGFNFTKVLKEIDWKENIFEVNSDLDTESFLNEIQRYAKSIYDLNQPLNRNNKPLTFRCSNNKLYIFQVIYNEKNKYAGYYIYKHSNDNRLESQTEFDVFDNKLCIKRFNENEKLDETIYYKNNDTAIVKNHRNGLIKYYYKDELIGVEDQFESGTVDIDLENDKIDEVLFIYKDNRCYFMSLRARYLKLEADLNNKINNTPYSSGINEVVSSSLKNISTFASNAEHRMNELQDNNDYEDINKLFVEQLPEEFIRKHEASLVSITDKIFLTDEKNIEEYVSKIKYKLFDYLNDDINEDKAIQQIVDEKKLEVYKKIDAISPKILIFINYIEIKYKFNFSFSDLNNFIIDLENKEADKKAVLDNIQNIQDNFLWRQYDPKLHDNSRFSLIEHLKRPVVQLVGIPSDLIAKHLIFFIHEEEKKKKVSIEQIEQSYIKYSNNPRQKTIDEIFYKKSINTNIKEYNDINVIVKKLCSKGIKVTDGKLTYARSWNLSQELTASAKVIQELYKDFAKDFAVDASNLDDEAIHKIDLEVKKQQEGSAILELKKKYEECGGRNIDRFFYKDNNLKSYEEIIFSLKQLAEQIPTGVSSKVLDAVLDEDESVSSAVQLGLRTSTKITNKKLTVNIKRSSKSKKETLSPLTEPGLTDSGSTSAVAESGLSTDIGKKKSKRVVRRVVKKKESVNRSSKPTKAPEIISDANRASSKKSKLKKHSEVEEDYKFRKESNYAENRIKQFLIESDKSLTTEQINFVKTQITNNPHQLYDENKREKNKNRQPDEESVADAYLHQYFYSIVQESHAILELKNKYLKIQGKPDDINNKAVQEIFYTRKDGTKYSMENRELRELNEIISKLKERLEGRNKFTRWISNSGKLLGELKKKVDDSKHDPLRDAKHLIDDTLKMRNQDTSNSGVGHETKPSTFIEEPKTRPSTPIKEPETRPSTIIIPAMESVTVYDKYWGYNHASQIINKKMQNLNDNDRQQIEIKRAELSKIPVKGGFETKFNELLAVIELKNRYIEIQNEKLFSSKNEDNDDNKAINEIFYNIQKSSSTRSFPPNKELVSYDDVIKNLKTRGKNGKQLLLELSSNDAQESNKLTNAVKVNNKKDDNDQFKIKQPEGNKTTQIKKP